MGRCHILIDSSVYLVILRVPGFYEKEQEEQVGECLAAFFKREDRLYLPVTTILEVGNHIGYLKKGELRRQIAERFVQEVKRALDGQTPWQVAPPLKQEALEEFLAAFPEKAQQKLSLGDALIIEEAYALMARIAPRGEKACIWAFDDRLRAYSPYPCCLDGEPCPRNA